MVQGSFQKACAYDMSRAKVPSGYITEVCEMKPSLYYVPWQEINNTGGMLRNYNESEWMSARTLNLTPNN